ncbi:hypothetical protein N0V88_004360 [Collariella sp. IMI 366227]|nr:hypothetical protein N0V88_004360 [Collariella sp. IMI 366227]
MSRALLRSVLELRSPLARFVPAVRTASTPSVRFFNQTTQHVEPSVDTSSTEPAATPKPLSASVLTLLPILAAQPGHYATIHIHGRPYLVTQGDSIRLPFKMPGVEPGDILQLNRATNLGSRDFTLKGAPYVDERLFACRAVVTGTEAEPMRIKIKKKRRCRKTKTVRSKHKYTVLRVCELRVNAGVVNEV